VARPTIRVAVLEVLADGRERTAYDLGAEINAKYGHSISSVQMEMSYLAQHRTIERRRDKRRYFYRRNDLTAAA
jgi:predicted transcriptional regulator